MRQAAAESFGFNSPDNFFKYGNLKGYQNVELNGVA